MDAREAFEFGALLRCAEEGLDAAATGQRLEKMAGAIQDAAGLLTYPVSMAKQLGVVGLLGAGLTGAAGGYGLSRLGEQDIDAKELQQQELMDAYRQYALHLRQRQAAAAMQRQHRPRYAPV